MTDTTRRNFLALGTVAFASVGLAGCSLFSVSDGDVRSDAPATDGAPPLEASRTLVAYFSVPETDDPDNMTQDEENSTHVVDGEVLGNTQYVAQLVAAGTGAELFRIETTEELPLDHGTLEELALDWQEAGTRPELESQIPNLDEYDTVFVGYPIWWYDLPMPLFTFFEQHDFTGKNIVLFTTHGGSRLSGTVERVTGMLAGAAVNSNGFTISRGDMDNAEAEVSTWLDSLGVQ
jgi:flavodoxin